jgi:hypothetical protein
MASGEPGGLRRVARARFLGWYGIAASSTREGAVRGKLPRAVGDYLQRGTHPTCRVPEHAEILEWVSVGPNSTAAQKGVPS